ncbi:hypothetical protein O9G_005970 [Rozella allomycis CSF55]|uniref:Uncharacterized protein n=1 Tax=Rozella allomycis (strain CSF55) TaxID=988480 RepID=A0A075B3T9_ROZAC|nr:hypothetical protein O9G_005970 [Rozella allomycis CSF55]|eukprot:EPZ35757.1 hypothetical protein O9G_005970 [Rozella allomycis CSF55]
MYRHFIKKGLELPSKQVKHLLQCVDDDGKPIPVEELKRLQITIDTSRETSGPQVITTLTASDQYSPVISIWKTMFDVDAAVEKLTLMDESNELPEGWEDEDQDFKEGMDAAFDSDYEERQ